MKVNKKNILFLYLLPLIISTSCIGSITNNIEKIEGKIDSKINAEAKVNTNVDTKIDTNIKTGDIVTNSPTSYKPIKKALKFGYFGDGGTIIGRKAKFSIEVIYDDGSSDKDVSYSSANSNILLVNSDGNYSAVSKGKTNVIIVANKDKNLKSSFSFTIDGLGNNDEPTTKNKFLKTFEGFKYPTSIKLDRKNNQFYIIDVETDSTTNNASQVIKNMNTNGIITDNLGVKLLQKNLGIGVDNKGNVYFGDTRNNVIKKYESSNKQINEIRNNFKEIYDIAVMTTGDLVLSDPSESKLVLLDSSLNIKIENLLDKPSSGIKGVATDKADNIYIIDEKAKSGEVVKKFDKNGKRLPLKLGAIGGLEAGTFNAPTSLDIDNNGDIYIVDSGNNRVQRFSSEGKYISEFGQFGTDNGSFNNPLGIAIDNDGYIYVSDTKNSRVQKFMP